MNRIVQLTFLFVIALGLNCQLVSAQLYYSPNQHQNPQPAHRVITQDQFQTNPMTGTIQPFSQVTQEATSRFNTTQTYKNQPQIPFQEANPLRYRQGQSIGFTRTTPREAESLVQHGGKTLSQQSTDQNTTTTVQGDSELRSVAEIQASTANQESTTFDYDGYQNDGYSNNYSGGTQSTGRLGSRLRRGMFRGVAGRLRGR